MAEYGEQIEESTQHAERFRRSLEIAAKRFAAPAKVEERHANGLSDEIKQPIDLTTSKEQNEDLPVHRLRLYL